MDIKTLNRIKKLKAQQYANVETGELLISESKDSYFIEIEKSDLKIISSTDYITIDSEVMRFVESRFVDSDLGKIYKIAHMAKGEYNILYNGKLPHTKQTLQAELDLSLNGFKTFINKLYEANIIAYVSSFNTVQQKESLHIIFNPFIARGRKTFDNEKCIERFEKFFEEFKSVNKKSKIKVY